MKLKFRRKKKRIGFKSSFGFIMAAAGSAVGLGNLWGFPYKTAKGGGAAFVLIYIACVIFIGFITMMAEMHLGKRSHANPVTAYKNANKGFGWMGLVAILIPLFITCYYSVLGGWTIKYAMNSFSGNADIIGTFSVNALEVVLFTIIFVALALYVIKAGVEGGIEKMSKVLMPTLFVILIGVVIYSLSLGTGVSEGLAFYLKPDFSNVTFETVLSAMGQAFWSLSLGMGIMITYGSYTDEKVDLVNSTFMICLFDTAVALLAGLAIFPAVAHFDPELLDGSKGLALMFIILPKVFDSMGTVGQIVSFFFFSMVAIAALTSIISLYEVCTQFFIQKFKINRKKAIAVVCLISFVISIPIGISLGHAGILEDGTWTIFGMDMLSFFDEVTNTVMMPLCALGSCIAIGWVIKPKKALEEMKAEGSKIPGWLSAIYPVFVKFITPVLIVLVDVFGIRDELKAGKWGVVVCAFALMALCLAVYFAIFANSDTGTNEDENNVNIEEDDVDEEDIVELAQHE